MPPLPMPAMPPTPQSIINERRSSQRQSALACGQDEICKASQIQERPPRGTARGFIYPPDSNDNQRFFVKSTGSRSKWLLEPEKCNHEFAFNTLHRLGPQPASQQLELLVCVPEIFRAFEYREYYFLVMEFVPGRTLDELLNEREDAQAKAGAGTEARAGGQVDNSTLYQ